MKQDFLYVNLLTWPYTIYLGIQYRIDHSATNVNGLGNPGFYLLAYPSLAAIIINGLLLILWSKNKKTAYKTFYYIFLASGVLWNLFINVANANK